MLTWFQKTTPKKLRFLLPVALAVAMSWAGFSQPASATVLVVTLDIDFGTNAAAGQSIIATLDDSVGTANQVELSLNVENLFVTAKVLNFYFNFLGDPTTLTFAFGGTADDPSPNVTTGTGCCKADGDGFFDIEFEWKGGDVFENIAGAGETFTALITAPGAIDVFSFVEVSLPGGGAGQFCMAAHVGNVNAGGNSDHLGGQCVPQVVPEPASLLLFGIGLLGLGVFARRRRRVA